MGSFKDAYYFGKWFASGDAGVPPHYRLGPFNLQDENCSCLAPRRLGGHSSREIPIAQLNSPFQSSACQLTACSVSLLDRERRVALRR